MTILTLTLPLLSTCAATAKDWPRWRGPARTNVSAESEWSSTGAAEPLWRADIGAGYSTPIVADGRVFGVGYRASANDPDVGSDEVVALDAVTGERLWKIDYPSRAFANEHKGGVIGTPVVEGDTLYVASRQGELRALDVASGEVRWAVDLVARHGVEPGRYGFASSPFVDGERVVVCMSRAIAVRRTDGGTLWTSEALDANYATVAALALPGGDGPVPAYAAFGGEGLFALDAATGTTLRRVAFRKTPRNVEGATPIVLGTDVFVSSGYDQGGALYDLAADPPELRWRTRRMRTKLAATTFHDGCFFGHDESMLACLGSDGELRWRERGLGQGALMIAGDRILLTTSEGELVVAAASADGYRELSRRSVLDDGVFWATPVLANGLVYVRGSLGDLVCLDHREDRASEIVAEADPDGAGRVRPAELEAAHLRATGAADVLARGASWSGRLTVVALGIEDSEAVWEWGPRGRWHASFALPPGIRGTVHEAFDGENAWKIDPYRGDARIEGTTLVELRATGGYGTLLDPLPEGRPVEYVGRESFRGVECHRVDVTLEARASDDEDAADDAEPRVRSVFFDATSGRLVGRTAPDEATVVLADWREVEGGWLPFRRTEFEPDAGLERRWVFASVELRGPAQDDVTLPESLVRVDGDGDG